MCIMCIEIAKERMTWQEADRNWGETRSAVVASEGEEHAEEVDEKVDEYRIRMILKQAYPFAHKRNA